MAGLFRRPAGGSQFAGEGLGGGTAREGVVHGDEQVQLVAGAEAFTGGDEAAEPLGGEVEASLVAAAFDSEGGGVLDEGFESSPSIPPIAISISIC